MADAKVAAHYGRSDLVESIQAALASAGVAPDAATVEDLAPVDEFHIGGRAATRELAERLELSADLTVLDVGCGPGGTARFLSQEYGCRVVGVDLTPEYVDAARTITGWLDLSDRIEFHCGSALDLPFDQDSFDRAVLVHVGMNIEDKRVLFSQLAAVLRPGGLVGVYDVMRIGEGDLIYPVPWASDEESSFVGSPGEYASALVDAGLEVVAQRDRHAFAKDFMGARLEKEKTVGRAPVGLHLLMGESATTRLGNVLVNLNAGVIAPVEIYARKPAP